MPGSLRDADIRHAVSAELHQRYRGDPDTLIRHEFGLSAGQRRVDVAVINGELVGYEIKSDVDTLTRLVGQAEAYGRVFDRMTIVTTGRYLDDATTLLPSWWGITRASGDGEATLEPVRAAQSNENQETFALAQLLWREEAFDELRRRRAARGLSGKRRWIIWQHLAAALSLPEMQSIVRRRLRERRDWPGGA